MDGGCSGGADVRGGEARDGSVDADMGEAGGCGVTARAASAGSDLTRRTGAGAGSGESGSNAAPNTASHDSAHAGEERVKKVSESSASCMSAKS